jgi:hypothetical protein
MIKSIYIPQAKKISEQFRIDLYLHKNVSNLYKMTCVCFNVKFNWWGFDVCPT